MNAKTIAALLTAIEHFKTVNNELIEEVRERATTLCLDALQDADGGLDLSDTVAAMKELADLEHELRALELAKEELVHEARYKKSRLIQEVQLLGRAEGQTSRRHRAHS